MRGWEREDCEPEAGAKGEREALAEGGRFAQAELHRRSLDAWLLRSCQVTQAPASSVVSGAGCLMQNRGTMGPGPWDEVQEPTALKREMQNPKLSREFLVLTKCR